MSSDPGFYSALTTPAFCRERLVVVGAGHISILGQVTMRLHIWSFLDNSHPLGSSAFLSDEKTCKEDNFGTCRMNQNTSLYGFLCKKLCVIFFVFVYFLWTLRFLGVMLHHINFYYKLMR